MTFTEYMNKIEDIINSTFEKKFKELNEESLVESIKKTFQSKFAKLLNNSIKNYLGIEEDRWSNKFHIKYDSKIGKLLLPIIEKQVPELFKQLNLGDIILNKKEIQALQRHYKEILNNHLFDYADKVIPEMVDKKFNEVIETDVSRKETLKNISNKELLELLKERGLTKVG